MSATNSSTARRRSAVAYGAAYASRTAARSAGRDSVVVARTNVGVAPHTACRNAGVRASRMSDGAAAPAGWCTAVLARTTAVIRGGKAAADRRTGTLLPDPAASSVRRRGEEAAAERP